MLSPEEATIMRCIAMGLTDSEIASRLGWQPQRIEEIIRDVCRKLNVTSRIELVFYASSEEGQRGLREAA
jgi:DNA-binding NarL/FixJ family response regulator